MKCMVPNRSLKGHLFLVWELKQEGQVLPWPTLDGNMHIRWFTSFHCKALRRYLKYWFWSYKYILVSRQPHEVMRMDCNCFKCIWLNTYSIEIWKNISLILGMWEFWGKWSHPHRFHVLPFSVIKLTAFNLSFYFLPNREQPIFSTRAHVFQIDPNTKKNWVPTSKHAVTVSYFYDSTRNVYRIISLDGSKVSFILFKDLAICFI